MFSFIKILLTLAIILDHVFSVTIKVKGGLIYKYEDAAQINQEYSVFKRSLDTSALQSVYQRLQDSTTLQAEYCDLITNYKAKNKPVRDSKAVEEAKRNNITVMYLATPLKYPLKDTEAVCHRLWARRVEIRDLYTYNAARTFANIHGIEQFEAGIMYIPKNRRFQFITDGVQAKLDKLFPTVFYGGSYTGQEHKANWEQDGYLLADAGKYPLIYKNPAGHFKLKLADINEVEQQDYVMCEQAITNYTTAQVPLVSDQFMQIAVHACKRDLESIQSQTQYTLNEISTITNLNFTINPEPLWTNFFPQLKPLDRRQDHDTFWYTNLSSEKRRPLMKDVPTEESTKDLILQRSKREFMVPYWDTTKNVESPYRFEHLEFIRDKPQQSCYHRPSFIFKPDASQFLQFPYETWDITTDVPKTLPDFVILMHTIWKIHIEEQYSESSFPDWMAKQGSKIRLYQLLRHSSLVQRVERNLDLIYTEHQLIFESYLKHKNVRKLIPRFQRTLEHLQMHIFDKMLTKRLEEMNITTIDFQALNSTELQSFLQALKHDDMINPDQVDYNSTAEEPEPDEDENTTEENPDQSNKTTKTSINSPRHKRAIPLIPVIAGIAGATIGSTASMLLNSHSQGTMYHQNNIQLLNKLATEVKSLRIDYQQTINVLNNVADSLQWFELQIMSKFDGVTSITMGIDLKGLNQNLQTVAQLTILKYNAALLAAADGRTSPYILSQKELDTIVQDAQKKKGLTLSDNLADVKTTASIEDNKIVFYFEIPIKDPKKQFNLYTVTPLPVFIDNTTYLPHLDSNHIAFNKDGDKFTTLTDVQLIACLDKPPRCHSYTAITPTRSGASCVATSYITDSQVCPLVPTGATPSPRFYFFDNALIYSTPVETSIYIVCHSLSDSQSKDQTMTLSGFGIQEIAPGCSLTMPDGTTHNMPFIQNTTELSTKIFREILQKQQPTADTVFVDNTPFFANIPRLRSSLTADDDVHFTKMLTDGFHPATVTANVTQTVILVISFLAVAALFYYYRRRCCRTCSKRASIDPPEPAQTNSREPILKFWHVEDDDHDPDTISTIAAQPSPPQPRGAMQTFYDAFPSWTKDNRTRVEQNENCINVIPSSSGGIVRTQPVDIPQGATARSYTMPARPGAIAQQDFDRLRREQQQMQQSQQPYVPVPPTN